MLTAESKTSKGSFRGLEVLPPLFFVTTSSRIVAFRNMTPKNSTRPDTGSKRINALRKSLFVHYPFIEIRNSSLLEVFSICPFMNSIASTLVISDK